MEDFYLWLIVLLLVAILIKLQQGDKKPTEEQLKKQRENLKKILLWMGLVLVIIGIVFFFLITSGDKCSKECKQRLDECSQNAPLYPDYSTYYQGLCYPSYENCLNSC